MDGQTSLPVSADVKVLTRIADTVHAEVPVRCIPVLQSLPTVKSIKFLTRLERLRMFVRDHYDEFAIDTTGDEPMIGVHIEVIDGDFSELDSAGIRTSSRNGNMVATEIPIRMMSEISSLSSVRLVARFGRLHFQDVSPEASGRGCLAGHVLGGSQLRPVRFKISLRRRRAVSGNADTVAQLCTPTQTQMETDSVGNFILDNMAPGIYDCTFEFPDERFETASKADAYDTALSLCDKVIVERVEIEAGVCSIMLVNPLRSNIQGQSESCRAIWQEFFEPIAL